MPDYNETEIKLYVPDLDAVKKRLEDMGARLSAGRVYERNVRYENAAGDLTERGVVVRLREDTRIRLTYKDPPDKDEAGISSRTEIEVEVNDFEAMEAILGKLGYHPHMVYEKYRTTYEIDDAEIVLDELPYGNFVEIEGKVAVIAGLVDRLGLQEAARFGGSYVTLFERVKKRLGMTANDLTFQAFEGVTVMESMFQ